MCGDIAYELTDGGEDSEREEYILLGFFINPGSGFGTPPAEPILPAL